MRLALPTCPARVGRGLTIGKTSVVSRFRRIALKGTASKPIWWVHTFM